MTHRFKIGDRVQIIGLLADFYLGKTGTVVAVEPNGEGIPELDRYVIEVTGLEMSDTKLAGFQLAPALNEDSEPNRQNSGLTKANGNV